MDSQFAKRKELCECGSGKKYRKCYGVNKYINTCIKFLKENVHENIQSIQKFFDGVTLEVGSALEAIHEKHYDDTPRVQCIILFSYLELCAKIWSIFIDDKTEGQQQQVINWFNQFIATEDNEIRHKHSSIHDLNGRILYKLRSHLVHDFAMPQTQEGNKLVVINSDSQHPEAQRMRELWKKKYKEKLIILSPLDLHKLIFQGAMLMIDKLNESKNNDEVYLIAAQRLANEIDKRGAEVVVIENGMVTK